MRCRIIPSRRQPGKEARGLRFMVSSSGSILELYWGFIGMMEKKMKLLFRV